MKKSINYSSERRQIIVYMKKSINCSSERRQIIVSVKCVK